MVGGDGAVCKAGGRFLAVEYIFESYGLHNTILISGVLGQHLCYTLDITFYITPNSRLPRCSWTNTILGRGWFSYDSNNCSCLFVNLGPLQPRPETR